MIKKRIVITLTFNDGVLFRTKKFKPDYRYTKNFVDLWSIDELIIINFSKKKNINNFIKTIDFFSKNCFVPITVGGGIKKLEEVDLLFRNGADKVLLGSNSIDNPDLINLISNKYGNQSITQSIDCKKKGDNDYLLMKNSATTTSNINPIKFSEEAMKHGIGELLINSVDNDGSLLGYDIDLINLFSKKIDCPLLALGGAGNWEHILELFKKTNISAACTQNIFHFTEKSITSAKKFLQHNNINIRN